MTQVLLTTAGPLASRLGGTGAAALDAALRAHAEAWAARVAPGRPAPVVAPRQVRAAARAALEAGPGPLLVAATDAPTLAPEHADMALRDLREGADASVGPGMDGGWYLVALARPDERLLALLAETADGPEVMRRVFEVSERAGLELGLLRMERLLRTPRDAAALRADPTTPESIRTALSRMGKAPPNA